LIVLKSVKEIEKMRQVNLIVAQILEVVRGLIKPGVATSELELAAEEEIKKRGVKGAFKGVPNPQGFGEPFPANLCMSLNDEIVHGIPSEAKKLSSGDLISIDFGVYSQGFYGDSAISVAVGEAGDDVHRLIKNAEESLAAGILEAKPGNRMGDLSSAVQEVVEGAGYNVVREFVGHGIGRDLHEDPQVPNFGTRGRGIKLKEGMVIAIEPMINAGGPGVKLDSDGWTARTRDGSLAAHVEHTVAITKDGPVILSRLG